MDTIDDGSGSDHGYAEQDAGTGIDDGLDAGLDHGGHDLAGIEHTGYDDTGHEDTPDGDDPSGDDHGDDGVGSALPIGGADYSTPHGGGEISIDLPDQPVPFGLGGYPGDPDADYGFEPVDPSTVVVDPQSPGMHGTPGADQEYWLYQGQAGTCAATSVAMVIADVTGVPLPSNESVVERALDLGLISYDEGADIDQAWSGMTDTDIIKLIESYGVDVTLTHDNTIDDLAAALDAGHSVMVGVDADEAWYGTDDDASDGGRGVDHELVVTGVDTENGLVYLNDPALPDGAGVVVPLEQFMDAWADDNYGMITTDLPEDAAAEQIDADEAYHPDYEISGRPHDGDDLDGSSSGGVGGFDSTDSTVADQGDPAAAEANWDLDAALRVVLLPFSLVVQMVDRIV